MCLLVIIRIFCIRNFSNQNCYDACFKPREPEKTTTLSDNHHKCIYLLKKEKSVLKCPVVQCFITFCTTWFFVTRNLAEKIHYRCLVHDLANKFPGSIRIGYQTFLIILLFTF
uniref:Uncharacterized protein n=1 Tax=Poecilia latipinna TaxID=48699 RepID=A0A3B3TWD2_9TELE